MADSRRIILALAGIFGAVTVACSNQADTTVIAPGQASDIEIAGGVELVDRIAYVGPNGDLFTIDPDGGGLAQLTGGLQAGQGSEGGVQAQILRLNEYYAWPTWSSDGSKLAASRVVVAENGAEITVQVMDARTGRSDTVYENEQAGLIADGTPHYIYWAPSGDTLSFLASTPDGLSLLVWDGTPGRPAEVVERGAPLYYHWAADAGAMALHVGPDITFARPPVGGASGQSIQSSANFRVPAISPDGKSLAYVAEAAGGMGLYVTATDDISQGRKIMDVGATSAFSWSPDGKQLAVADQANPRSPIFERLMLVPVENGPPENGPAEDGPTTTVSTEGVLAFYWSPAGDSLAWVEVNAANQEMEWVVSPSDGSNAKRLFSFQPSSEVFIMLSFFDQYANSHSPWSPDGKSLVVAGSKGEAARRSNGHTPTGDRIYILDAAGDAAPRDLGAGVLAFWSWN